MSSMDFISFASYGAGSPSPNILMELFHALYKSVIDSCINCVLGKDI